MAKIFDTDTARFLDDAYHGSDATRRRRANFDMLAPATGDTVVDIGCGTGLLAEELARAVGPNGRVIGVDPSAAMRRAAEKRLSGRTQVTLAEGTATALPVESASADRAVSVQVFEYLDDLPGALAEAARVLRPNGRLVVGDWHWDTLVWASDNPARMARAITAWDAHLVDRVVPEKLPALMPAAGFGPCETRAVPYVDTTLRPDGIAMMMLGLIHPFIVDGGHLPKDEADAWRDEQLARAAEGRFFFSFTHFVMAANKA